MDDMNDITGRVISNSVFSAALVLIALMFMIERGCYHIETTRQAMVEQGYSKQMHTGWIKD